MTPKQLPAPEVKGTRYYIQTGDVDGMALWWLPEGSGYTTDLDEAGEYDETFVVRREVDIMVPVDLARRLARRCVLASRLCEEMGRAG